MFWFVVLPVALYLTYLLGLLFMIDLTNEDS